jgi:hypothetical protein
MVKEKGKEKWGIVVKHSLKQRDTYNYHVFDSFIAPYKKGEIFVTNPAIAKSIELHGLKAGGPKKVGGMTFKAFRRKGIISIEEWWPFMMPPLSSKGLATLRSNTRGEASNWVPWCR